MAACFLGGCSPARAVAKGARAAWIRPSCILFGNFIGVLLLVPVYVAFYAVLISVVLFWTYPIVGAALLVLLFVFDGAPQRKIAMTAWPCRKHCPILASVCYSVVWLGFAIHWVRSALKNYDPNRGALSRFYITDIWALIIGLLPSFWYLSVVFDQRRVHPATELKLRAALAARRQPTGWNFCHKN